MRTEALATVVRLPAVSDDGVLFLYSPNLGIRVRYGSLVIDLGGGRSLKIDRANEPRLKRVVISGHGWWSFECATWLRGIGASWVHLDLNGRILGSGPGDISPDLPALRRAQALSAGTDAGITLGADMLTKKVSGQRGALSSVPGTDVAQSFLSEQIDFLQGCSTVVELRTIEARAAIAFWEALSEIPVRFIPSDESKVPESWRTIGKRSSAVTGRPLGASTPAQCIWNYSYSLAASECEIALRSVGLDPGISATGLHADTNNRSAATWDLVETIRGDVDRLILAMVQGRRFRRREFAQLPDGRCRLTAPLARELAEAVLPVARQAVGPVAEGLARTLASEAQGVSSYIPGIPTNLTGDRRSRGRKSIRTGERKVPVTAEKAARALLPPTCRNCGVEIERAGNREYCEGCYQEYLEGHKEKLKVAGPAALERFWTSGDALKQEEARRRIGEKNGVSTRERAAWDREHGPQDPEVFRTEILPKLKDVPASQIAAATGLSRTFAATIRSGKHVPHPRHWEVLRALGGSGDG